MQLFFSKLLLLCVQLLFSITLKLHFFSCSCQRKQTVLISWSPAEVRSKNVNVKLNFEHPLKSFVLKLIILGVLVILHVIAQVWLLRLEFVNYIKIETRQFYSAFHNFWYFDYSTFHYFDKLIKFLIGSVTPLMIA